MGTLRQPWHWVALCVGVLSCACHRESVRTSPDGGPPPLELGCGPSQPCPGGARCTMGRCVSPCRSDEDCSARERCESEGTLAGFCVSRHESLAPDPCAGALCAGSAPVCHPVSGDCVACTEGAHCPSAEPVCDRGRGLCVAAHPGVCAACERDTDCAAGADAGVSLACVAFDEPYERVCVQTGCREDADCLPGFACSPTRQACFPARGSCTSYRAALAGKACSTGLDCSARGVPADSVLVGVCHGGACALGCDQTPDCPGVLICAAQVCVSPSADDAGVSGTMGAANAGDGGV